MSTSSKPNIWIHLHTLDLRLHDSPSPHLSHDTSSSLSSSITHFLPVYIFDQRQLDLSHLIPTPLASQPKHAEDNEHNGHVQRGNQNHRQHTKASPRSRVCEFHRTSPYRLRFLLEAVYGLRENYRRSGGDMLIGCGKPETLLPSLLSTMADQSKIVGVSAQNEYTVEESNILKHIEATLPKDVPFHSLDSKTLVPPKHLPFDPATDTPEVYTVFRTKVEGMGIHLDDGMLVEPLKTAIWSIREGEVDEERVSVGKEDTKLKPFPNIDTVERENENGWIKKESKIDSMEGMYVALAKPLFDSPPIGGWSSAAMTPHWPTHHIHSAIPFSGDEHAALGRLEDYVGHESSQGAGDESGWVGGAKAKSYKSTRNGMVGEGFSTKFAGFFSLGALSAREVGWRVGKLLEHVDGDKVTRNNVCWILFELLWRDYFQFTTLHYSTSKSSSLFDPTGFSSQISTYPSDHRPQPSQWHTPNWSDPNDPARRWCEGRTGVPFVDACMRELRETGYMSNRGRQNVASFLTKDLYVDWRVGAEFFEMHLVDYDTCSNWGNWQYQAGVGNDPRSSRQFNPIKQAHDYDPHAEYVRLWMPELNSVPYGKVQTPWLMNKEIEGYPARPIVEQPQWRKFYCKTGGNGPKARGSGGRGRERGNNGHCGQNRDSQ